MRKILALFLSLALLLGTAMPAFAATGEGNIDGGGGNMGSGNSSSYWNPGMDGVRVTVINAESHAVVTTPVDLTNKTPSTGIIHFGKVCKLTYNGGASLSPVVGGYSYRNPSQSLPRIISSGSSPASIEAIRSYFTDEQVIRSLAGYVGMDFDTLVNGDYKIIIEPIAYLNYDGQQFAMTATEAALYDQVVSGNLRYWMGSLTHQNLPLAIFLEEADLGYWGLISSLPDARFLMMIEHEKSGPDLKAALVNTDIFYCYIDDFYSGNADELKFGALIKEMYRYIDSAVHLNVNEMFSAALKATRIEMSDAEKKQFMAQHIRTMQMSIAPDGEVVIEFKNK